MRCLLAIKHIVIKTKLLKSPDLKTECIYNFLHVFKDKYMR